MEDSRTQRPYRYGMILLCLGALINWLGISEPTPNAEPIKYLGVACILGKKSSEVRDAQRRLTILLSAGGALLIMTAMCCWLKAPNRTGDASDEVIIVDKPNLSSPPLTDVNHHHSLITELLMSNNYRFRMKKKKAFNDSIKWRNEGVERRRKRLKNSEINCVNKLNFRTTIRSTSSPSRMRDDARNRQTTIRWLPSRPATTRH